MSCRWPAELAVGAASWAVSKLVDSVLCKNRESCNCEHCLYSIGNTARHPDMQQAEPPHWQLLQLSVQCTPSFLLPLPHKLRVRPQGGEENKSKNEKKQQSLDGGRCFVPHSPVLWAAACKCPEMDLLVQSVPAFLVWVWSQGTATPCSHVWVLAAGLRGPHSHFRNCLDSFPLHTLLLMNGKMRAVEVFGLLWDLCLVITAFITPA